MDNSIRWGNTTDEILDFVSSRSQESPAISFVNGFKMIIKKCEEIQRTLSHEISNKQIGSILNINGNGTFIVKTGDGIILVSSYSILTPYEQFTDIRIFLTKSKEEEIPIVKSKPFDNNQEANEWEKRIYKMYYDSENDKIYDLTSNIFEKKSNDYTKPQIQPGSLQNLIDANVDFVNYLIRKTNLKRNDRVLDLGCGGGWATYLFSQAGMDSFGCDLDAEVRMAKKAFPSCTFFTLDVFDLPKYNELDGKFNFIFCRSLGVAQKIVDWDDPNWINVGKSLLNLLTDDGIIYWSQYGDMSDKMKEDGMANASPKTMMSYFKNFGYIMEMNVYGYMAFLITKKQPDENLLKHVNDFRNTTFTTIFNNWLQNKNEENSKKLAKVLYSKASEFLLTGKKVSMLHNSRVVQAYDNICNDLHIASKSTTKNRDNYPSNLNYDQIYLISGDHDSDFDSYKLTSIVKILLLPKSIKDHILFWTK